MTNKFDNLVAQIFEAQYGGAGGPVQSSTPAADAATNMVASTPGDKSAIMKLKNVTDKNKQTTKDALRKAKKEAENNKRYVNTVSTA